MPAATTTVVYPQGAKCPFLPSSRSTSTNLPTPSAVDMSYYMSTHMPLVAKHWTPLGLKSWKVLQFPPESPYCVQATLEWGSMDDFKAAAGHESAKEVMGDIKNFSDKEPVLMSGEVVGTS